MVGDLDVDWLSFLIAALAVGVAVWSAWYTVRVARETSSKALAEAHRAAQAESYQRLHEALVDPAAARGRRKLFMAARVMEFPAPDHSDWDEVNYSLALYDTLGGYIFQSLVDEETVMRAWHHPLQNIREPVVAFMAHRARNGIQQPWSFLLDLLHKATLYRCDCPHQPGVTTAGAREIGSMDESGLDTMREQTAEEKR